MSLSSSEARWRDALEASMKDFLSAYPAGAADELYDPIHYLLSLGGKRIRPVLALAACEAEAGALDAAMPAAMAVELFHNFTLMHDDIMDEAPLRRGRPTVHTKWSENAAILSGDVMYTLALTALEGTPSEALADVLRMFNVTSKEVCEGQQSDMAFETRDNVTVDEYLNMIRLKTSVLLAAAAAMGARSAGASPERVEAWYRYGVNVGLAFQIQDDFLDTFGESGATGKQVGGAILADKKGPNGSSGPSWRIWPHIGRVLGSFQRKKGFQQDLSAFVKFFPPFLAWERMPPKVKKHEISMGKIVISCFQTILTFNELWNSFWCELGSILA